MKHLGILLSVLVVLSVLSCGPTRPGVKASPFQEKEKIVLLDRTLSFFLNVVKHTSNRLPGGQLEVKMEMENEENDDVWTDIQIIFKGADGYEVEKTDWEPFLFHRRKVTLFQKNSLSAQAADYRVLIRHVKHNK